MDETVSKLSALLHRIGGSTDPKYHHGVAIVLAAGVGSRMQARDGETKQMMLLGDMPIIARTLRVFQESDAVEHIVVVARREELGAYEEIKRDYGISKLLRVVEGGETRQDSALCGFKVIPDETEFVLIHDGARCLITGEQIERVARSALANGAAIAAQRVTSTVKQAGEKDLVASTLDRNTVWLAQTPQGFLTEVYRAAVYLNLQKGGAAVTDDAMLVEQIGLTVKLVDCGEENLKITTPTDLLIASAILEQRAKRDAEEQALLSRTEADRRADREKRRREAAK